MSIFKSMLPVITLIFIFCLHSTYPFSVNFNLWKSNRINNHFKIMSKLIIPGSGGRKGDSSDEQAEDAFGNLVGIIFTNGFYKDVFDFNRSSYRADANIK